MPVRLALLAVILLSGAAARAADWPAFRGPNRDGINAETGLLKEWPKDGPPLARKITDAGGGYGTPAVAGGRVYLAGDDGKAETPTAGVGVRRGRDAEEVIGDYTSRSSASVCLTSSSTWAP